MDSNELEKLKKRLYRKGETFVEREERSPLTPAQQTKTYWEKPQSEEDLQFFQKKKTSSKKKFLFFAISIFILASFGVSAYYFFFGGFSVISSRNIEIRFEGPSSVKGGEETVWQALITNNNKTDIELADLIIDYPEDSRPSSVGLKNSGRVPVERRSIGLIKAGQTVTEPIKAYLLGEKDSEKKFKLTLEYRPQGSNAILEKIYETVVRLLQSPIEISIEMPQEANAGELFSFKVDIISNAEAIVGNLHLKMEYPSGFNFKEADLKPASGDNIWRLGDLEPNKKRTIAIKGSIEGQDQVELAFRALSGPVDENGEVIVYGFDAESITLRKPFLKLGVKVNGKDGEAVFSSGENLRMEIEWQNTLPTKIYNASIEAKVEGESIDRKTISVDKGFYRSFDNALVWNQSSAPELSDIEPMASGLTQFTFDVFKPLPQIAIAAGNPTIKIEIEMKAERISEEGRVEIKNHFTKEIKIATLFQLSRRAFYSSGPFKNTGPLPPKIGKETTYAIVWSLSNTSSEVSEAVVSAFLPSYVRWLNVVLPENENISYNQGTGEITWRAGKIPVGTGVTISPKELMFQISFLPNVSQIGAQPVLVSEVTLSGRDSFAGAFLRDVKPAQTTNLESDTQFEYNDSIVVQ